MTVFSNPFYNTAASDDLFVFVRSLLGGEYDNFTLDNQGIDRGDLLRHVPNTRVIVADVSGAALAAGLYIWAIGDHMMRVEQEILDVANDKRKYDDAVQKQTLLKMRLQILECISQIITLLQYPQILKPDQICVPMTYQFFITRLRDKELLPIGHDESEELLAHIRRFMVELSAALSPDVVTEARRLEKSDLPPVSSWKNAFPNHDVMEVRSDKYLMSLTAHVFEALDRMKGATHGDSGNLPLAYLQTMIHRCYGLLLRYRTVTLRPAWVSGTNSVILEGPVIANVEDPRKSLFIGRIILGSDVGDDPNPSN